MAKRRTRVAPRAESTAEPPTARLPRGVGALHALALGAAVAFTVLGYLSQRALNPDGVSYLDLAAAVQRSDWQRFVQGYWSPLLPFVVGLAGKIAGLAGATLIPVTHAINVVAALGGLWILWRCGRSEGSSRPLFGIFAIAAFLLCSAGLPRLEAVTPDIISLLVMIWLGRELLVRAERRWIRIGVMLGVAFLVKTSAWPWLVVAVPLRLWAARSPLARRRVWWSTATCALVMLTWIVPLSSKAGRPTLGSSGRLNWSWYIKANTSRLPDGDRGVHGAYRQVSAGTGQPIVVATFEDAEHWTYQPWGDPTAWAERVITDVGRAPTPWELITYWLRMFVRVFGLWLGPMIVATMVPAWLLNRRPAGWRDLMTTERDALVVIALGLTGLLQFVAIHAEPRLLAPYGILLALGTIWICTASPANRSDQLSPKVRRLLPWIGVLAAAGFAVPKFVEAVDSSRRLTETTARLEELKRRLESVIPGTATIGVVGPAAPVMSAAYWSGVHLAMQVPPSSAQRIAELPPDQQTAVLTSIFRDKVPLVWKTSADGGIQFLVIPGQ